MDFYLKTGCFRGEAIFGWMLRLEQKDGVITIPDSAGQTWFLTVFLDSEINRGGEEEIRLLAWLLTKFGEPVNGIRNLLTMD